MAKRYRHPNKHIEAAVQSAVDAGWRLEVPGHHAWGTFYCSPGRRGGCIVEVWSTPKNPVDFAKQVLRRVSKCTHVRSSE